MQSLHHEGLLEPDEVAVLDELVAFWDAHPEADIGRVDARGRWTATRRRRARQTVSTSA